MRSFLCMRRAQQCRARRQSAAVLPSLAPHDSKARVQLVTTRRDSWRSHVHRTRLRSACSSSSAKLRMCGVEGEGPSSFLPPPRLRCAFSSSFPILPLGGVVGFAPSSVLSGVVKGDTLFREREYPPFTHSRTVRESSSCSGAGKYFYASGVRTPFSVTSIVQRISCSSTGTSGDISCSRQMSTVGQWSCGSRRS